MTEHYKTYNIIRKSFSGSKYPQRIWFNLNIEKLQFGSTWSQELTLCRCDVADCKSARALVSLMWASTRDVANIEFVQWAWFLDTVRPLIAESLWAKTQVSTGAIEPLDYPPVVQKKIWKNVWDLVNNAYQLYCFLFWSDLPIAR